MGTDKPATNSKRHLFQVEILLEDNSPALAIASLMQLLSNAKVKDFRITGGMELGKAIEQALASSTATPIAAPYPVTKASYAKSPAPNAEPAPASKPTRAAASKDRLQMEMLEEYKEHGTLVRLTVVKGKGVKLSMPCRILNFDASDDQLTIYHVDEKRVYSFKLNEIEDIVGHGN